MRFPDHRWILAALSVSALCVIAWLRMRRNPEPYRYARRGGEIPRPFLRRGELCEILGPRPGESVLEVGPGKGYYSLEVARQVSPNGILHILDVQREMLDHTSKRARDEGIENVTATLSDAADLPFPDGTFDAAFLVAVLGEVPDGREAVRELRRVLRPGGRLVVGEAITDPHRVPAEDLREMARGAGFSFVRESGGFLGRFYLFET